jgi:hypothetical protein
VLPGAAVEQIDLWRVPRLLVKEHGYEKALSVAAERAADLACKCEQRGTAVQLSDIRWPAWVRAPTGKDGPAVDVLGTGRQDATGTPLTYRSPESQWFAKSLSRSVCSR